MPIRRSAAVTVAVPPDPPRPMLQTLIQETLKRESTQFVVAVPSERSAMRAPSPLHDPGRHHRASGAPRSRGSVRAESLRAVPAQRAVAGAPPR